ncbi:MAG: hypothetical protein H6853_06990 [Rhodospirillales bacterium]|nr:hypothetical protein [Alphaproteobacteria bacterium]USO03273.1 MAG: hypothetical protein H6853_06990 [Rhodospirillales bacterium]
MSIKPGFRVTEHWEGVAPMPHESRSIDANKCNGSIDKGAVFQHSQRGYTAVNSGGLAAPPKNG